MKGTPDFQGTRQELFPWSIIAAVALLTVACFNIIVEEPRPKGDALTVMPVLGELKSLPAPQPSNQGTSIPTSPELVSANAAVGPTAVPGPTFTKAPAPLPTYRLSANQVPATGPILALDGGAVEISLPPREPAGLYWEGDLIRLTAIPAEGYRFDAWGGDCISDSNVCKLAIDGNKDFSAGFVTEDGFFELDVVADPDGGGQVQVRPSPNAPGGRYVGGTRLELQAIDSEGFGFTVWGGACAGVRRYCRVVMDTDKSVTASFVADFYTLTVNRTLVDGAGVSVGHGQIAVFPFVDTPNKDYARSAIVSLTVDPDAGYVVVNWGGDCTGLASDALECTLTMDSDKLVEVTFAEEAAGEAAGETVGEAAGEAAADGP